MFIFCTSWKFANAVLFFLFCLFCSVLFWTVFLYFLFDCLFVCFLLAWFSLFVFRILIVIEMPFWFLFHVYFNFLYMKYQIFRIHVPVRHLASVTTASLPGYSRMPTKIVLERWAERVRSPGNGRMDAITEEIFFVLDTVRLRWSRQTQKALERRLGHSSRPSRLTNMSELGNQHERPCHIQFDWKGKAA